MINRKIFRFGCGLLLSLLLAAWLAHASGVPLQTDVNQAEHIVDERGVPHLNIANTGTVDHPAWTALYALAYAGIEDYDPILGIKPDPVRFEASIAWLKANLAQSKEGLWIWPYQFDNTYNDVSIKAPWGNAFAQATGIQALLAHWHTTQDKISLALAEKAAQSLFTPLEQGGFLFQRDDAVFFEEITQPAGNPSHILNGHMRVLLALDELNKATEKPLYADWFGKGMKTLLKWLPLYDAGYWLRYDLNPRKDELLFRLANPYGFANPEVAIDRIVLRDPVSGEESVLDIGAADDAEGALRIAGNDWGQIEQLDGRSVRRLLPVSGQREPFDSEGQMVAPYSYFYLKLPGAWQDNLRRERLELMVEYLDEAPGNLQVQMRSIAPGASTFRDLRDGDLLLSGSGQWRQWRVPLYGRDLGFWVGKLYVQKHAEYLHKLAQIDDGLSALEQTAITYLNGSKSVENFRDDKKGFVAVSQNQETKLVHIAEKMEDDTNVGNYVSITHLGNGQFVIANYGNLFIFDRHFGSVCTVSILKKDARQKLSTVNPTGVYFSGNGKLYVANYKVNNILEGAVDVEKCEFHVEHEYKSANSLGPENVWVDAASNLLVSANYDAGTVTAFDLDEKIEVWSAVVPQAHGVAISDGTVYATSLTDRSIYKINIFDGSLIKKKGSLGWNPMQSEFIWPTSIYPFSSDNLIVSDSQSGFLSVVQSDGLDVIRYTGGNGPSAMLFNYPYAAVPVGNEIVVMQSMRSEIVFLSADNFSVTERFYLHDPRWPAQSKELPIFGGQWRGYEDFSGNVVQVGGRAFRLGFGSLNSLNNDMIIRAPDVGSPFNNGGYMYFLQEYSRENVSIIFSSSSDNIIALVKIPNGITILIPGMIKKDSWVFGDVLLSGDGSRFDLERMASGFNKVAEIYGEELRDRGWISKRRLYGLIDFSKATSGYNDFIDRLNAVFSSSEGRRFLLEYDKCSGSNVCDVKKLRDAARLYYAGTKNFTYHNLDEYLLVGMVSGVNSNDDLRYTVEYNDCGNGNYYPQHGLNTLQSPELDDYLAAVDISRSVVCFAPQGKVPVVGINIVWNDLETASKYVEIYGREKINKEEWELIGKFRGYSVNADDGYARSSLVFNNNKTYDEYFLKVIDGGSQQRLLVREILPIFNQ